jgi:hypothetical protein
MSVKKIIKDRDEMAEGMQSLMQHFVDANNQNAPRSEMETISELMQITQGLYKKFDEQLKDEALDKTKNTKIKTKRAKYKTKKKK